MLLSSKCIYSFIVLVFGELFGLERELKPLPDSGEQDALALRVRRAGLAQASASAAISAKQSCADIV